MGILLRSLLFILLSLVVPLSFYIKQIEIIYLIGLAVLCLIYVAKHNYKLYIVTKTPLRYYAIFLYISLISEILLLVNNRPVFGISITPYIRIWIYLVLMLFLLSVSYKKSIVNEIVFSIIISSFIPNTIALAQIKYDIFTIINSFEGQRRIGSTFSHPNFYAYYLVIVIICLLYKIYYVDKKSHKLLLYAYVIFNSSLIIFTYARTPMIILFVIISSSILSYVLSKHKYLTFAMIVFFIVIFSVSSYFILKSNLFLTSRFNISENGSSFTWRLGMWFNAMSYWAKDIIRIIFGCGWVTSKEFVEGIEYRGLNMHNEFLRMIFDTGIMGFLYYFTFIVNLINQVKRSNIDKAKKVLFKNLMILFVIGCANDNIIIAPENYIYIIILFIALSAEAFRSEKEELI
jgi:putative inorganic carbon (HCO3(-)) transporter